MNSSEENNEEGIKKKCKIEINGEAIPFNFFIKFKKTGTYKIKYIFKENITNTTCLFYRCKYLTNIDLSNFNIQNVTDIRYMFSGCDSLKNIDLSNFNTQNATNMSYMFHKCNSLQSIDL